MITNDYCSIELTEALQRLGADVPYNHFIRKDNGDGTQEIVLTCTHQAAIKWLRKVHNILVIPRWVYDKGNTEVVYGYTIFKVFPLPYKDYSNENVWYVSYEEAVEAALKYTLENLI